MDEPDPSDGPPDDDQKPQDNEAPRHKRKQKRPHLRTLARALFFALRVYWWFTFLDED